MKKFKKLKEKLNNKSKGQQLGILIAICAVILSVMCISGCDLVNSCSGCASHCFGCTCANCTTCAGITCFGENADDGDGCVFHCIEGCGNGCVSGFSNWI